MVRLMYYPETLSFCSSSWCESAVTPIPKDLIQCLVIDTPGWFIGICSAVGQVWCQQMRKPCATLLPPWLRRVSTPGRLSRIWQGFVTSISRRVRGTLSRLDCISCTKSCVVLSALREWLGWAKAYNSRPSPQDKGVWDSRAQEAELWAVCCLAYFGFMRIWRTDCAYRQ